MWWLKAYLLAGVAVHKVVWERLKSRQSESEAPGPHPSAASNTPLRTAAKAAKVLILAAIIVQPLLPDVWPIVAEPFWLRVIGAAVFTLGLAVAIHARLELGPWWADIETGGLRPHHQVVGGGVYRWIRHPIYVGDLLLLLGYELALNSWAVVAVAAVVPVVVIRARDEERALTENVEGYAEYRLRTKAFIPFVI